MSNGRTVNLDTYGLSLLTAKEDVLNPRSSTNWALFAYDGVSNKLKLADSGVGGVAELAGKFHISKPQYGLCRVGSAETGGHRIAMITWVGENVDDYRRTECARHIPVIKNYFKEAQAFISAVKVDDVTEEKIRNELSKSQAHGPSQWVRRSSRSVDKEDIVGTNYRKTNAAMEMRLINRDSFWARAEREEEQRKDEERRRAAEERRRLERERVLKERKDAEERDRKMNEKLQIIAEQRRKQAEKEEELHRQEKLRWEKQQREHEDDMRARLRRSESIEKAAEAAVLVSQRTMNPREFFRQLSSTSQSPTSPGSSRTGKPLRRYQRSLTDTAFIFSKAEENMAPSPRSSPLVSPYFRASPSPFHATSPPTSPDFRPVYSPQRPRIPISPPGSPLSPTPKVSALPFVPNPNQIDQLNVKPKAPSPTEPSAPPASPDLLASLSSNIEKHIPPQSRSMGPPASPPNTPTQPENSAFSFEPDLPPQTPIPDIPLTNPDLHTGIHVQTELVSDTGYKAQAVLIEVDEEDDMEENEEADTQSQMCALTTEPVLTEAEEQEQVEEKDEREEREEKAEQDVECESLEAPGEVVPEKAEVKENRGQNDQYGENYTPSKPAELSEKEEESACTDAESVCLKIIQETVDQPTNGVTNEDGTQAHNGREGSLSPSDTETTSPDLALCYDVHSPEEKDDVTEKNEEEFSNNGHEVLLEQQMCVRALYDYQAEDESEISFEPGDIIRDVETVDKAWWRGLDKDGRQGLFPANYVETI